MIKAISFYTAFIDTSQVRSVFHGKSIFMRCLRMWEATNKKGNIRMTEQIVTPSSDSTPLPLAVASLWNFQLNYHKVDGELFYAVEDWISGLASCDARKSQKLWVNSKAKMSVRLRKLSHTAPNMRVYQKDHTDNHGLYLIAQFLRTTKTRMNLPDIKLYLISPETYMESQKYKRRRKKPPRSEKSVRNMLVRCLRKIHGDEVRTEVSVPAGNADIVTPDEIIEVKEAKSWKHALGQVIAYGVCISNKKKRIHLFRGNNKEDRRLIEEICQKLGVIVTWEEERNV